MAHVTGFERAALLAPEGADDLRSLNFLEITVAWLALLTRTCIQLLHF